MLLHEQTYYWYGENKDSPTEWRRYNRIFPISQKQGWLNLWGVQDVSVLLNARQALTFSGSPHAVHHSAQAHAQASLQASCLMYLAVRCNQKCDEFGPGRISTMPLLGN